MNVLITGATGFIGSELALYLADQGITVHALCRSEEKARKYIHHPNIIIFKGDIENQESLNKAITGCEQVYHLAAFARVWHRDPEHYYRVNVEGTRNVLKASIEHDVKKVVFTSTAGVLGPSNKYLTNELSPTPEKLFTHYERSKKKAEELALSYCDKDLNVVIVNPSRLFGPGMLNESNSVSKLIMDYINGKWHFLPGNGRSIGNYAYIKDIVRGHVAAMNKGRSGERYILGGENLSYIEFFERSGKLVDKQHRLYPFPLWMMLTASWFFKLFAVLFNAPPLITPPWVRKYAHNWQLDTAKAESELEYAITPFDEAVEVTIEYFKKHDKHE